MKDVVIGGVVFVGIYACMLLANEERLRHETRAKQSGIDRPRLRKVAKYWAMATDALRMLGYFVAFAFWSAASYRLVLVEAAHSALIIFLITPLIAGSVYGAIRLARWRLYKVLPEEKEKAIRQKRPGGDAKP